MHIILHFLTSRQKIMFFTEIFIAKNLQFDLTSTEIDEEASTKCSKCNNYSWPKKNFSRFHHRQGH